MLHLRNPGRDEPSLHSEAFDGNGVRVEEVGEPYNRTMFFLGTHASSISLRHRVGSSMVRGPRKSVIPSLKSAVHTINVCIRGGM